jgi:8-amino-7-oxononanoate synthase
MLDFTAVHYLGFRHSSRSLPTWERLTTGVPAALREPEEAVALAARLARLQGCQKAVLGPSTLHLFWDLIPMLARWPAVLYLEAGSYPIAGWGVERAAGKGAPVRTFPHHDAVALCRLLERHPPGSPAVVICDGISPCCGQAAPLGDYLAILPEDGWLVVDDTQALGLLGDHPTRRDPYGRGGGGSARLHELADERLVLASSLAKGFGAPLAVLSGSRRLVASFVRRSETRVHCSPPAMPEILAAGRALALNERYGDALRRRLAGRIRLFQEGLASYGLAAGPGLFPIQTVQLPEGASAFAIEAQLRRTGVATVLRRCPNRPAPCLSFVISARHTPLEIDQAAWRLKAAFQANGF